MARTRRRPLSDEEIGAQSGTELPRREALSLVFVNIAAPAGLAGTLNPAPAPPAPASDAEPVAPVTEDR